MIVLVYLILEADDRLNQLGLKGSFGCLNILLSLRCTYYDTFKHCQSNYLLLIGQLQQMHPYSSCTLFLLHIRKLKNTLNVHNYSLSINLYIGVMGEFY